jgi:hypothetical protein
MGWQIIDREYANLINDADISKELIKVEEYLFDYMHNCVDDMSFEEYLNELGVTV